MKEKLITLVVSLALAVGLLGLLPAPRALAATTYYSTGSVAPDTLANWKANRDGTGASPTNFTSGDVFVIQNGHNMTTSAAWTVSGTGSKLWIENGGMLTATNAVTLATATTFQIDAGGTYVHDNANAYGSTIFQGTEAFDAASTVILNNSNTTGPSSVTFGNLTVNFTTGPSGSVNCSGGLTTINGDLTIQSTSTHEFRLTGKTNFTLNLTGNLIMSGGTLDLASDSGAPTINIGGNFNQTGGTFKSSGSVSTVVFTGGSPSVTFATSGGTFTNDKINWQIASGKTVANNTNFSGSWVNASRTMTVNGAFQINQGSWTGSSGTWSYGSGATLIFNNTSGSYGSIDGTHVYWPAANGPTNVTVQGAGGITLGVARTVAGTFQTAAGVTNGNHLTLNGTTQINAGGFFTGSPTYGTGSTLVYNTGGVYGRGAEWNSTSGAGYPYHVQVTGSTTLNYPNGSTAARSIAGNLTIDTDSALYMNYGSPSLNSPLTVAGSVTLAGSLALGDAVGGDLHLGGNWINNGGTLNANSRSIEFNGSAAQTIGGSTDTAFAYLTINNSAGVSLNRSASVDSQLNLTNGQLSLGNNTLTLGSSASVSGTPDASKMVVTDVDGNQTGKLCKVWGSGAFTYPIGDNRGVAEYSPVSFTPTSPSGLTVCFRAVDAVHPDKPATPTTDYLTRYWSGTTSAGSFTGYTGVFTFINTSSDVVGSTASMLPKRWTGAFPWQEQNNALSGATFTWNGGSTLSDFTAFRSGILAVTLAEFYAEQVADHVLVSWETASELGNMGFNLLRGTSPAGWDRQLNDLLIPSQSLGNPGGFVYTWEDAADLVPGTSYFYWLQDVDVNGATTLHGPVSVDFVTPTAVTLGGVSANQGLDTLHYSTAAALSALPGLAVVAGAGVALALGRRRTAK